MVRRKHPLEQSSLFRIKSKRKLASILQVTPKDLIDSCDHSQSYERFRISPKGKKPRAVQKPKGTLLFIHKRICRLLSRVHTPEYLHSAVKKRSYITNAREHQGNSSTIKIDIKNFFNNVKRSAVYRFFSHTMQCPPDVADLLSKILTCDGHLATGSCASPILSFFVYKDLFDSINSTCLEKGCKMTCYVDDISITGSSANENLLYEIRCMIHQKGLKTHKRKYYSPGRPKIITGVLVQSFSLKLPNARHLLIHQAKANYGAAKTNRERYEAIKILVGRLFEGAQLENKFEAQARHILPQHKVLTKLFQSSPRRPRRTQSRVKTLRNREHTDSAETTIPIAG